MPSSTKETQTKKPCFRLKVNPPTPEASSETTTPAPRKRLRINLPHLIEAQKNNHEETSAPDLEKETVSSEGTVSRPASPASCDTLSPVSSEKKKEDHEEDKVYEAAWILYLMAHSKRQ